MYMNLLVEQQIGLCRRGISGAEVDFPGQMVCHTQFFHGGFELSDGCLT